MRLTPLLAALVLVVAGLGVAVPGVAHSEKQNTAISYRITDQGLLTAYGGPVVSPLGGHVENPATEENVFVPCGEQSTQTNGSGGHHQHIGSCVTYSIYLDGDGDGHSAISATVEYDQHFVPTTSQPLFDLDLYLYGPDGDIVDTGPGGPGPDAGFENVGGNDLPEGSYTVLLVARHGAAPYDTTITVTD